MIYPSGSSFDGWWKNGKKQGHGVEKTSDGGRFEGEFMNGKRNGKGFMRKEGGKKIPGHVPFSMCFFFLF